MTSRLTASAAIFAILAAAFIGFAAAAQQSPVPQRTTIAAPDTTVIVFPTVVVTGKRIARN
jgi:hypothetical protein